MNDQGPPPLFALFMAVWIALGLGSAWFFSRNQDAQLKRRVHRWLVIGCGLLFAIFAITMTRVGMVLFIGPGVALISYLNLRMTKFCDACGAMTYNHQLFGSARFCSKCGAALDVNTRSDGKPPLTGA